MTNKQKLLKKTNQLVTELTNQGYSSEVAFAIAKVVDEAMIARNIKVASAQKNRELCLTNQTNNQRESK